MCLPAHDPTVQQKVKDCLAQCLECVKGQMGVEYACPASSDSGASILNGFVSSISFSLIWPVIISGTQVRGTNRTVVMDILNAFRGQCEWRT